MSVLPNFWDNKWKKIVGFNIGPTSFGLKVAKLLGNKKINILDLGCGAGRDSLYLSKIGYNLVGIDFSTIAIEKLTHHLLTNNIRGLNILQANILKFESESTFDCIYSCNSLHYFTHSDNVILFNKYNDLLNVGGYFTIRLKSIHDYDYGKGKKVEENMFDNNDELKHYFSKDYLKTFFNDFEIIECEYKNEIHNKITGETVNAGYIDIIAKKLI